MRCCSNLTHLALFLFFGACAAQADLDPGLDAEIDAGPKADRAIPDSAVEIPDASAEMAVAFADESGEAITDQLYGEAFSIRVVGAPPSSELTISCAIGGYASFGKFTTDTQGTVDTTRHAPHEGTYEGVEPEGLVWSMLFLEEKPIEGYGIECDAWNDEHVANGRLERLALDANLTTEEVRQDGLVATLFRPAQQDEDLPGLIVLGGSEGGLWSAAFQAAWFANYGYVTMALAYFREPGLPQDLSEIPLEYFAQALAHLQSAPGVDAARLGVFGASRGSEAALMIGANHPEIKAVIGQVPSDVRWGGVRGDGAAWTEAGLALPWMPEGNPYAVTTEVLRDGNVGYRFAPVFADALQEASASERSLASIEVEDIEGAVLLLGGKDDGIWPSCTLAQNAFDRLKASGHASRFADEVHCFEDAGHFAPQPGWSTQYSYASPLGGLTAIMGGTPKGTARAKRQSLEIIKTFLAREL